MWACGKLHKLKKLPVYKIKQVQKLFALSTSSGINTRALSVSLAHNNREEWVFPSIYSDVLIPDVSFPQFIFDSQEKFAGKIGLVNGETNQKWTHGQIRDETFRLSSALSRLGVSKGDTVALISANCPEFVLCFLAIVNLGAVASTFNSSYTASEICHQLINSDSVYVICHEDKLFDTLEASKDNKNIRQIFVIGKESEGVLSIQKLIKNDDGKGIPNNIQINPREDILTLPYSSGTTGLPKGVMLTHRNLVANITQVSHPDVTVTQSATDDFQEKLIGLIPLYHIYGLSVCMSLSLVSGSQMITLKQFEQKSYISAIRKHQVTNLHLVPPLMSFLTNSDLAKPDLIDSVKFILCGAAPVGKSLLESFFNKFGRHATFIEGYGMTEASPGTHVSRKDKLILGSCGPALPNTWTKIIDLETNQPLKFGSEGELCVKGPQVMKGYYKNEKSTRETIDEEGWLHTGDIARMDEDQNVYIVDRLKDLIKVKALQVAPAELEDILRLHPLVEDVAVTSVPDERSGELPIAFVVPVSGMKLSDKELQDFVAVRTSRHKHLDGGVKFVKEIPKSAAGKILRRELKKLAAIS